MVVNRTTISYSNIKNGITDVGCRINNTFTQMPITIPYVSAVSLSHSPRYFQMNNNFTATCGFTISPNVSNYVVSLVLNDTAVGQYINVRK